MNCMNVFRIVLWSIILYMWYSRKIISVFCNLCYTCNIRMKLSTWISIWITGLKLNLFDTKNYFNFSKKKLIKILGIVLLYTWLYGINYTEQIIAKPYLLLKFLEIKMCRCLMRFKYKFSNKNYSRKKNFIQFL